MYDHQWFWRSRCQGRRRLGGRPLALAGKWNMGKAAKKAFEIFFRHRRKDMPIVDDAMNQLTAAINLAEPT